MGDTHSNDSKCFQFTYMSDPSPSKSSERLSRRQRRRQKLLARAATNRLCSKPKRMAIYTAESLNILVNGVDVHSIRVECRVELP